MTGIPTTRYEIRKDRKEEWRVYSSRNQFEEPIRHPYFTPNTAGYLDARNWVIDTKLGGNAALAALNILEGRQ